MSSENKTIFNGVKDGETFHVAEMEFIKFPANEHGTPVMLRDVAFRSRFDDNNDLRASTILRRMKEDVLPKIIAELGEENVLTFKTDLTALDGLRPYEDLEDKISLCTLDFYRQHVQIMDKYPVDQWWWLATPFSAEPHDDDNWFLCVAPSGVVGNDGYGCDNLGVRPFLIFNSSIFGSCEE